MEHELLNTLEDMGAEVEDTLERLMGEEELYLEYIMRFPENENIKKLRAAIAKGDFASAEREVHTLKGVALNLGFLPLVDVCMDMLLDFRSGKTDEAETQLEEVEENFKEWSDAIEAAKK